MLAGEAQGAVAAGDETLDEFGGDGEGGRALAGVEDAETAGCAGADVEEASAAVEAGCDLVDGAGDVGELGADRSGDGCVLVVDDAEHVERRELIEIFGRGVAGFGEQRAESSDVGGGHR